MHVDGHLHDAVGRLLGHLLNINPAVWAGHDHGTIVLPTVYHLIVVLYPTLYQWIVVLPTIYH